MQSSSPPSLAADCVGHIVSFLESASTFFRILRTSSHVYNYFHSYGAESCSHFTFTVVPRPRYLTEECLAKPFVRCIILKMKSTTSEKDFSWIAHFPNLRKMELRVNPTYSGDDVVSLLLLLRCRETFSHLHLDIIDDDAPNESETEEERIFDLSRLTRAEFPALTTLSLVGSVSSQARAALRMSPDLGNGLTKCCVDWFTLDEKQSSSSSFDFLRSSSETLEKLELWGECIDLFPTLWNSVLPNLKKLKRLNVDSLAEHNSDLLTSFSSTFEAGKIPRSVKILNLECGFRGNSIVLTPKQLQSFPQGVEVLCLSNFEVEVDIAPFLPPVLKTLKLQSLKSVSGDVVAIRFGERLAQSLENLEIDQISPYCHLVIDISAVDFCKLEDLSLCFSGKSTGMCNGEVFKHQLKRLDISKTPLAEEQLTEMLDEIEEDSVHLASVHLVILSSLNVSSFLRVVNPDQLKILRLWQISADRCLLRASDLEKFVHLTDLSIIKCPSLESHLLPNASSSSSWNFLCAMTSLQFLSVTLNKKGHCVFPLRLLPVSVEVFSLSGGFEIEGGALDFSRHHFFKSFTLRSESGTKIEGIAITGGARSVVLNGCVISAVVFCWEMFGVEEEGVSCLRKLTLQGATSEQQEQILSLWGVDGQRNSVVSVKFVE